MSTELPISSSVSLMNSGKECLTSFSFHIPAFQRPYSWGEDQIDDFLKTITDGFIDNTPKFFGTMQFVVKNSSVDVVDGQQRLTTMKLFAYVLSGLAKRECFNIEIDYNNMKNASGNLQNVLVDEILNISKN